MSAVAQTPSISPFQKTNPQPLETTGKTGERGVVVVAASEQKSRLDKIGFIFAASTAILVTILGGAFLSIAAPVVCSAALMSATSYMAFFGIVIGSIFVVDGAKRLLWLSDKAAGNL